MGEKTIYLVYGYDHYENPCDPVKAFESEASANAMVEQINAYGETRPSWPSDDASDEEYEAFQPLYDDWRDKHPAGPDHVFRDGFAVMHVELVSTTDAAQESES